MADTLTKEKRSWNMSRIKGKDTKPELLLRSMLHKEGFRFRIHDKNLPGKPDIVLPRYHTVIFVNGCFWHRHSGCKYAYTPKSRQDFWSKKFEGTIQRDVEKENKLKSMGWKVLTAWECELKQCPNTVLENLATEIQK
jgi:DNA mismatch endonuclease (patch repair protein)